MIIKVSPLDIVDIHVRKVPNFTEIQLELTGHNDIVITLNKKQKSDLTRRIYADKDS